MFPGSKQENPIPVVGKPHHIPYNLGTITLSLPERVPLSLSSVSVPFWKVLICPSFTGLENTYINQVGISPRSLGFVLPICSFLVEWVYMLLWVSSSLTGLGTRYVGQSLLIEDCIIQSNGYKCLQGKRNSYFRLLGCDFYPTEFLELFMFLRF